MPHVLSIIQYILFLLSSIGSAQSTTLNTDPSTWEGWLNSYLVWASTEPWTFLTYVMMLLSPCFCISAVLSWRLGKQIENQQKKQRRKAGKDE